MIRFQLINTHTLTALPHKLTAPLLTLTAHPCSNCNESGSHLQKWSCIVNRKRKESIPLKAKKKQQPTKTLPQLIWTMKQLKPLYFPTSFTTATTFDRRRWNGSGESSRRWYRYIYLYICFNQSYEFYYFVCVILCLINYL